MPRFKSDNTPVTPGIKLKPSVIKKLKYIAELNKRSQGQQIEFWIDEEFKRLKKIEKQENPG